MNRWMLLAAAGIIVLLLGCMPFSGTDVAMLKPVESLLVTVEETGISVRTDTGDSGSGDRLDDAFEDMKRSASGNIFLETAEYLIVNEAAVSLLPQLWEYLRPGCGVCVAQGEVDMEKAGSYLNAHKPGCSLQDYRAGNHDLPRLLIKGGKMYLVP